MSSTSLTMRFQGDAGRRRLSDLLQTQTLIAGDGALAGMIADLVTLRELAAGDLLIRQGNFDNDVYFLLSGSLQVLVNGREVARRGPGSFVGELAVLDAAAPRSATVIALQPSVVALLPESEFARFAAAHPVMWRGVAFELKRRLDEQRLPTSPNQKPTVFVGSATESLPVAEALCGSMPADVATMRLWSRGVFAASTFTLEDLEHELQIADFAAWVIAADDQVICRGREMAAPRDNIIFELGLFMGALGRRRNFLLLPGRQEVKIPSDLLGLTWIHYDEKLSEPAERVAGVVAELTGLMRSLGAR